MVALPTYLLRRPASFYFRTRIPKHLLACSGRKELCLSLHTTDKREALKRSATLVNMLHNAREDEMNQTFSLIKELFRADGAKLKLDFDADKPADVAYVEKATAEFLRGTVPIASGVTLFPIVEGYLADLEKRGKAAAVVSCTHSLSLFKEVVGDVPVSSITQVTLGEFRHAIEKLPNGFSKKREYAGLSIKDVLAMASGSPISASTLAGHVRNVVSMTTWAKNYYEGVPALTARGVAPVREEAAHELRDTYSITQLEQLFSPPVFDELPIEAKWLLRLGVLTGARIEELCQLDINGDIQKSPNGVLFLSINSEGDKKIKTATSKREIPVHPKMLELGFESFIASQRERGVSHPFETLWKRNAGKWGKYATKWFSGYKTKLGFGKKLVFHSFRHTVADTLVKAKAADGDVSELLGHTHEGETRGRYAKRLSADDLYPTVLMMKNISEVVR